MFQSILQFLVTKEVYSETEIYYTPTLAGNISLFLLAAILCIAMAAFSGTQKKMQVKQLVFSSMAVALAVVTSTFMKFAHLPYGGSITFFSMLFICLIGYLYGTKAGITAGIAYGFINLIIDPVIMHPVQLLLDYPIAFGCLGLTGVFTRSKFGLIKGYLLGVFGRYVCHVITGVIFFNIYAPENMNSVVYSIGYNVSYILPEAVLTIIILFIPVVQHGLLEVRKMATE